MITYNRSNQAVKNTRTQIPEVVRSYLDDRSCSDLSAVLLLWSRHFADGTCNE